jgi:hypothetical protein
MALPDDSRFGGDRTCGQCVRSCATQEEDFVACGASADDNPIWAIRKYSLTGMRDAIAYGGTNEYLGQDCDRMRRDDGWECPAFIRRKFGGDV